MVPRCSCTPILQLYYCCLPRAKSRGAPLPRNSGKLNWIEHRGPDFRKSELFPVIKKKQGSFWRERRKMTQACHKSVVINCEKIKRKQKIKRKTCWGLKEVFLKSFDTDKSFDPYKGKYAELLMKELHEIFTSSIWLHLVDLINTNWRNAAKSHYISNPAANTSSVQVIYEK